MDFLVVVHFIVLQSQKYDWIFAGGLYRSVINHIWAFQNFLNCWMIAVVLQKCSTIKMVISCKNITISNGLPIKLFSSFSCFFFFFFFRSNELLFSLWSRVVRCWNILLTASMVVVTKARDVLRLQRAIVGTASWTMRMIASLTSHVLRRIFVIGGLMPSP